MPLLLHYPIQLPHRGASSDGSETTKITKQHNYDKVTDIWARWYTANTNAKSQSPLEITHSMSLLYDAWWIKGTDSTIISMQGKSAIYTFIQCGETDSHTRFCTLYGYLSSLLVQWVILLPGLQAD